MSTDRDLISKAAKAADIDLIWKDEMTPYSAARGYWNPLREDADAFRLLRQVDYGLLVEDGVVKIINNLGGCVLFLEIRDADEMTIIRRAITMAAAAAWSPGENDGR